MPQLVIDEAWSKSDPIALKKAGYVGALMYLSHDAGKSASVAAINAAHAAGIAVGLVFEDQAQRALQPGAGVADGLFANEMANVLGFPTHLPIYYAIDFAVGTNQLATVLNYVKTAGTGVGRRPARGYGSAGLVDYLATHGIPQGWQTSAWSGKTISSHASIYQRLTHTLPVVGGSYDEDVLLDSDPGLWIAAPPTTPPTHVTTAHPYPGRMFRLSSPLLHGADVQAWQAQMTVKGYKLVTDGIYGPVSATACSNFERARGLQVDGIVGPIAWNAVWA